ncbi:1-(5-phosphoribosyl)-5-[(5-phosphoribosylamino)methylideneamino]imidazole-4-carboxamide isomerase [Meiothermus sp. QL-1]|uniref:1-(5-phosphoribosyl)-5-[(5- phosphoribosylamino)methylideneamino]imidazole-4- carboxamide isomerase n=1 Tax=Meiothermus sp. QL-1 TaxID=2058095 RepID=UPI000E0C99D3|nr:1-(5-phosphoribosyl)-5-[(5-phosphoribosylamino)methylideneamino]imidazole-4-carboxamide isomerase [Meiothermus sp. QL-1]RDI96682.1 1-(5-phosphoribosyl)-5-[(5-phosphoribosylamino)methylideneamino]imidazole-4-carboxamide isomerase [Meiothermus sp. QL-1]
MLVIPAVDIQGGRVVRLYEGDPSRETVYFNDPVEAALHWQAQGAPMLHLVDLDAATGRGENRKVIADIAQNLGVPFQVGGGVRSLEAAQALLALGAQRVVVGTVAVKAPGVLEAMLETLGPERVVVSLDARGLEVVVSGWTEATPLQVPEACRRFWAAGVRTLIYTDVRRDGTLRGLDQGPVRVVRAAWPGQLIAGGGIASEADLEALRGLGVEGALVGRALYEGRIDLGRWGRLLA